ncbi:MAG: exodeoxyribonuclease V subunit alpha [Propionibacteriaceae bacterium]
MSAPAPPTAPATTIDPAEIVWSARGLLATFNRAGVLGPADVHTAVRVGDIAREPDESVRLALALVVRALRTGSVCLDLERAPDTVLEGTGGEEVPVDVGDLPWPDPTAWQAACRASPLVGVGPDAVGDRPLRLVAPGDSPGAPAAGGAEVPTTRLYLERYWQQEETVRTQLRDRRALPPPTVDRERLRAGLDRLFTRDLSACGTGNSPDSSTGDSPDSSTDAAGLPAGVPDQQRLAAAVGVLRWVSVLAGGPGTGKTTTVARLLVLLQEQQPGVRIALAAPTGKAAARLQEAVRGQARDESAVLSTTEREWLTGLPALTLDRLLGWLPGRRYRHHADNHLPYDVIVVDETSMVSLTMMSRFLEAVRPQARIVFVGDPDQLSSVEAGAVLADVVNAPVAADHALADAVADVGAPPTGTSVTRLQHTWRFGGTISTLANAIRAGDADAAVAALRHPERGRDGEPDVVFVETDLALVTAADLPSLVRATVEAGRAVWDAAHDGDARGAISALDRHRLLCAHRQGPYGVARWSREVERWLARALGIDPEQTGREEWYPGRPLMITANDYELQLYNGDTGVVVASPAGPRAVFGRGGELTPPVAPVRLEAVQTLHATTVHKAQGSQFGAVSLLLPPPESPLLTRELLYTAVTRAEKQVFVYGSEGAVRRAVTRPANRATGLRERLR